MFFFKKKARAVSENIPKSVEHTTENKAVREPEPVNRALPREVYYQIADEYSRYCSLSLEDGPEQKEREKKLLSGGRTAQAVIAEYLGGCAGGQRSYGWWEHAADLTRMLRRIDASQAEKYLSDLKSVNTNIWEYHTQVIQVAEQELLEIKKADSGYDDSIIPPEDASTELQRFYNSGKNTEEKIQRAIELLPSVEDWSDKDKGFYYYIIGEALKQRDPNDSRRISFYAAQVYYIPEPTSLGWTELSKAVPNFDAKNTGFDTARQLVKKYPLPDTLEELLDE